MTGAGLWYAPRTLAGRVKGPPPPSIPAPGASRTGTPNKPTKDLRARNAAGKQARSAPKVGYKAPRRVNTEAEEMAAFERHHRAELEDEAVRHAAREAGSELDRYRAEEEEDLRVKGINFDEERKKRGKQQDRDDDAEDGAAQAARDAAAKGLAFTDGSGKYFQDLPEDRLGDLSLTDPNEMKRLLGPSVRFAQQAMVLAESRLKTTHSREEALAYLAELYVGLGDRAYAQKALREFGPATGIIDLYPLELIDHLLAHVPSFFTKVKQGRFFSTTQGTYRARAGEPIMLRYEPSFRIRGFAVKGGSRPGYLFEPVDPPGSYRLVFSTPGTFTLLVSAITKDGWLLIEELRAEIAEGDPAELERLQGVRREIAAEAELEAPASGPEAAEPSASAEAQPKKAKDNLTIHYPRRI